MTRRLVLSYLVITLVVLAMLEIPLGIFYAQRERDRLIADIERDANVIATIYEDDLERGHVPDPTPAARYHERTGARVVLVDDAGMSKLDTGSTTPRDFSSRPEIESALQGDRTSGVRNSERLDRPLLYVAVPVASGGVVHGALRVTLDASSADQRVHRFWVGLAGVSGIIITTVGLVGWALALSVTRPIRRLSDTATRYSSGDLSTDDEPVRGPPEIQELAVNMETMAGRLALLIEEQRDFVADASHQLRTPLTALRLRLENLQTHASEDQAGELDSIMDESSRLALLVADLLQLARADEQATGAEVDLRQLVAERTDMWSALAEERGMVIELAAPDGAVPARAVAGAVEQVLDNLLDNAVNASPAHGTVRVEVAPGPLVHTVTVSDSGPGLSDDDKVRALHRFWRGDTSTPGTGLGLAIASALVAASGGSITLTDSPDHGLRVVVSLAAVKAR